MQTTSRVLDRRHRFDVGDRIAHRDAPRELLRVSELTAREVDGVLYPTYTLVAAGESVDDVLDTADLVWVR